MGGACSKHGKDEKYIQAESKVLLERTIILVPKIILNLVDRARGDVDWFCEFQNVLSSCEHGDEHSNCITALMA
jgi:hypothetical protein